MGKGRWLGNRNTWFYLILCYRYNRKITYGVYWVVRYYEGNGACWLATLPVDVNGGIVLAVDITVDYSIGARSKTWITEQLRVSCEMYIKVL